MYGKLGWHCSVNYSTCAICFYPSVFWAEQKKSSVFVIISIDFLTNETMPHKSEGNYQIH
jgi:hypothetical protein